LNPTAAKVPSYEIPIHLALAESGTSSFSVNLTKSTCSLFSILQILKVPSSEQLAYYYPPGITANPHTSFVTVVPLEGV